MNIKKYRKRKMEWTVNYVFGSLCYSYLCSGKKQDRTIPKLEKILFLMQDESLKMYGIPLIPYEIYYFNNKIYIKYLSDILRVSSPDGHSSHEFMEINEKYKYDEILTKKYMRFSVNELDNSIKKLIVEDSFDAKYYKFIEFKNEKFIRKCARFQVSYLGGIFALFGFIALGNLIVLLITIIMYFFNLLTGINIYPINEGVGTVVITSPALIVCYILLKKMIKPTKFEIKNEYLIK